MIARTYPVRLGVTFGLVAVENVLYLIYPLSAGFAVDAILRGDALGALVYAAVVSAFWTLGALRRAVDTRTFTRIYADIAVPVVLNQRNHRQSTSTAAARVMLAREFVDFFEKHIPVMATALVSLVGAVSMLLLLEPWLGAVAVAALALCAACTPSFARANLYLHQRLNDRLEKEVALVDSVGPATLGRHYRQLSRIRIALSDREAGAYLSIGIVAVTLFVTAIWRLAASEGISAGHIYTVVTYLWMFVGSLDEIPTLADHFAKLRDIGKRVQPRLGD